jgi:uncharacterized membrane protein
VVQPANYPFNIISFRIGVTDSAPIINIIKIIFLTNHSLLNKAFSGYTLSAIYSYYSSYSSSYSSSDSTISSWAPINHYLPVTFTSFSFTYFFTTLFLASNYFFQALKLSTVTGVNAANLGLSKTSIFFSI